MTEGVTRGRRQRGVVLVVVAVAMVALLTIVAIVIDLGATRSKRRDARLAADIGATAGASALSDPTAGAAACADAMAYTYFNLGGAQPTSAQIGSACSPLATACVASGSARVATLTVGTTTVSVTNPVPASDPLMTPTAVGGGTTQSANAATDGTACARLGVEITMAHTRFFGGIADGAASPTFDIHAVARFAPAVRASTVAPALVALNQTTCNAISAGNNGTIVVKATTTGPGIAYSDSDGSASPCPSGAILESYNSARLIAETSNGTPGQLGWFQAPSTRGYINSSTHSTTGTQTTSSANYVGTMVTRPARTTRVPVDKVYHCRNVPVTPTTPLCTTADPVAALQTLAASSTPPAGYTTWTGPCDSTAGPLTLGTVDDKIWVDCPVFQVKGNRVSIPGGGTVIFNGKLAIDANGLLAVNVGSPPTVNADGYPTATGSSRQTTLIVRSTAADAISMQSTSSQLVIAQTTIYSRGGVDIQGSPTIRWTAPSSGDLKGLLYWSESTQAFSLQGGPTIRANGVLFHGNGPLTAAGNGTINLTNVQVWVDTARISTGTPTLLISPDPDNSVKIESPGSQLVR